MSKNWRYVAIALVALFSIGLLVNKAVSGTDTPAAAAAKGMMSARAGACATFLSDYTILITGGTANRTALATTELFSVRNGTIAGPTMTAARTDHVCVALPNGAVLVAGGSTASGALNSSEMYDPATGAFSPVGPMMMARAGATASLLPGGRVLIAGGEVSGAATNALEVFDSSTRTFSALPQALLSKRSQHAAVVLQNGKVLLFGGTDGTNSLDTIESFDPASNSVALVGKMSMPRAGLSATVLLDGTVYLAGGNADGKKELASAEIYNPKTGALVPAASLGAPRRGHLALRLPENNGVLIIGGNAGGQLITGAELYIPWWNKYKPLASLKIAQTGFPSQVGTMLAQAMKGAFSASVVLAATSDPSLFPVISTDKDDYSPGQTATITGSGWPANATVSLHLDRDPNHASLAPKDWTVTADPNGGFTTTYDVVEGDLGETFTLTAYVGGTMETAKIVRTVKFTDGSLKVAGTNSAVTFKFKVTVYNNNITCSAGAGNPTEITVVGTNAVNAAGIQSTDSARLEAIEPAVSGAGAFDHWTLPNSTTNASPSICVVGFQSGNITYLATYKLDSTAPTVTSITRANTTPTNAAAVQFNVTFSETVTGVDAPDFAVAMSGVSGAFVTGVSGSGSTYTVAVNTGSGDGTLGLNLLDNDSIVDGAGNKLGGTGAGNGNFTGQVYTIDKTPPTVTFGTQSPAANAAGWNNTNVSFPFTTADTLSGIDTTSPVSPLVLSMEGTAVTGTVTVTDKAGNSATFTSAAVKIDKTAPIIAFVNRTAANAHGWNNSDITLNWSCTDPLSGPIAATLSQTVSSEGQNQSSTGTCTDSAGNTAQNTQNAINIDKTKPTVTAAAAPAANANGWNNTDVTVTFTGIDGLSGIDPATCTAAVTFTTEGANQSSGPGTCADKAGNIGDTATKTGINIDKSQPTLSFGTATPTANAAGWNNSNVSFPFTTADSLSGVESTSTASPLVLSTEGSAITGTVTVTDRAGNSATFTSPAVKIDQTAPIIAFVNRTAANANGWNNTDVTLNWSCADTLSGPTAATVSQTVSAEGQNQSSTGTCTDSAGNTAQNTQPSINIDKTKPTINPMASPAANANGWNNTDVTVTFTGIDGLSGIDPATCTAAVTFTTEGANQSSGPGTCADKAGNMGDTATKTGINIDKTKPTLSFGTATPAANAAGWNNSNISFPFTTADSLSGVESTSTASPLVLSTEGSAVTGTVIVTDKAGNSATFTSPAAKIDKTPPGVVFDAPNPTPNSYGWNNTNVSIAFTPADNLSGVMLTSPVSPLTLSAEGSAITGTVTVTDYAGNTAAYNSPPVKIDKTTPNVSDVSVSPNPIAYTAGTSVIVTATVADLTSTIQSVEYRITNSPNSGTMSLQNGSTYVASLGSFTVPGVYEVCIEAQDKAGNMNILQNACTLLAIYDPTAGFVTGGGWIISPAGAYVPDLTLSGRANFGFVSKYKKGQTVPDGETEFQFQAAGLNFHSTSYSWLVVSSSSRAQFKGMGTINGAGNYNFLLTATDGDAANLKGPDKFRIKIMNRNSDGSDGTTVYDNNIGLPDTGDPATVLGGGSIQIQDSKK